MKLSWNNIPKTFRACIVVSLCLVIVACVAVWICADATFALQTAIMSVFSFALLCAYVVWASRISLHVKMQAEENGDIKETATAAATKIQLGSLAKTLILAGFIVLMIVGFKFSVYAALIGVSIIYIPLYTVPLFVKPASDDNAPDAETPDNAKVE